MTDQVRFLKKKKKIIGGSNVGSADLNQAQVEVFLEFGSLIFLEISYNNGLQQFLTSSRGKTHEKHFWGPNLGQMS